MKKITLILFVSLSISYSNAQTNMKDSLKQLLQKEKSDTGRVLLLADLSFEYLESKPDSTMVLALEALSLSRRTGFLKQYPTGAVFDEVQRVPLIFRYLQEILDNSQKRGQFILTGSNNFLLQEQVSQSLAGRAGYLTLLPLSFAELLNSNLAVKEVNKHILTGGYPEIWNEKLIPGTWMNSYVQTYVQRDVRLLRNITNLGLFNRFIYLCANYAGQILNRDELAKQTGVDTKTILAWLGFLENSYIVYWELKAWQLCRKIMHVEPSSKTG